MSSSVSLDSEASSFPTVLSNTSRFFSCKQSQSDTASAHALAATALTTATHLQRDNALLDRVADHEADHGDRAVLAEPVRSIHGLSEAVTRHATTVSLYPCHTPPLPPPPPRLHLSGDVPPAVHEEDAGRRREVQRHAAGLERDQEDRHEGVVAEGANDAVARGHGHATVQLDAPHALQQGRVQRLARAGRVKGALALPALSRPRHPPHRVRQPVLDEVEEVDELPAAEGRSSMHGMPPSYPPAPAPLPTHLAEDERLAARLLCLRAPQFLQ